MKKQLLFCAGLLLLGVAGTGTAGAQAFYYGPRFYEPALPPWEIVASVRSAGLVPLTRPSRRGPVYVLAATDRAGRQLRVVVNARFGNIMNVSPMLAAGPYGAPLVPPARIITVPPPADDAPVGYGPRGTVDGAPPPVPPRAVPNARLANAPPVTGAIDPALRQPERLPLPRPRPALAATAAPAAIPAAPAESPATTPAQSSAPPPAAAPAATPPKPDAPTPVPVAPLD